MSLKVEEIHSLHELQSLKRDWDELSSGKSLFMSFDWIFNWQKEVREGQLIVLVAKENKKTVGIMPLALVKKKILLKSFTFLEFVGQIYGYHLDLLAVEGKMQECSRLFAGHIFERLRPLWDCLYFIHLKDDSPLQNSIKEKGICRVSKFQPCKTMPLPQNFEEYLAGLSKSRRKKYKRDMRRCSDYEFAVVKGEAGFEELWKRFLELHLESVHGKGQGTVFDDRRTATAYKNVCRNKARANRLVAICLKRGAETHGIFLGAMHGNCCYFLNMGYSTFLKSKSVGIVLLLKAIEFCCNCGVKKFDLLAGGEKYKSEFGAKDSSSLRIMAAGRTARLLFNLKESLQRLKNRLKA